MMGKARTCIVYLVASVAILLGTNGVSQAATCNVGNYGVMYCTVSDVATLNQVFDQADVGTTSYVITLSPGTYLLTKTLSLTRGAVTIKAGTSTSASQYVLDGGNSLLNFSLVAADPNSPPSLTMTGVTVQNGMNPSPRPGGCFHSEHSKVFLFNSIIQGCHADGGGGIYTDGGGEFDLWACLIQNNYINDAKTNRCGGGGFSSGGGMLVVNGGKGFLENSAVVNNLACRGGGLDVENASLSVFDSTIAKNSGVSRGGAVRAYSYSGGTTNLTLDFNTIVENKATTLPCTAPGLNTCAADPDGAGGIAFDQFTGSTVELIGNIIALNSVSTFDSSNRATGIQYRDCDKFFNTNLNIYDNSPYFKYSTNVVGFVGNCGLGLWWGVNSTPHQNQTDTLATIGLNPMATTTVASGNGSPLPAYKPMSNAPLLLGQFGLHDVSGGTTTGSCGYYDNRMYLRSDKSWLTCDVGAYELNGVPEF